MARRLSGICGQTFHYYKFFLFTVILSTSDFERSHASSSILHFYCSFRPLTSLKPSSFCVTLSVNRHKDYLFIVCMCQLKKSRDSSVGITLGYGLDDCGSRVRFPTGAGNFSLHRIQNGSGAHPASYPIGTRGSFPGGKATGA
jgi:hypothetical protein